MNLRPQDHSEGNQAQYNKKYAIHYQKPGEEELKQIVLELPSIFTVGDCIDFSIEQINIQDPCIYIKSKSLLAFKFQGSADRFKLKVAKKNGKPKDDLPALDNEQQLIDTGAIVFALVLNQNQQQLEKQITFAPTNQSNQTQQSQPNQQDSSIKQRTSYSNSLSNNKKNKNGGNDQKNDANGFCFFKQCA
ncbi:unnamed protein product (macronuclear) [Paramecium tetraurelia]|uniref:Uncharacterized protein n=1 Tax=Paramecium tetraurelia TaxID=5888 RepID=A0E4P1_PARTE|nr:uncharacterized protein GSPATT00023433001 [Paramecium tetraurelia]CAK90258.1 unnamed protein product [Paramecium tetraurelia]|eukprot:XP_001457655.1 hypothetical protein (macronuclear) [Paramecium tetraurelia strain d4-2]